MLFFAVGAKSTTSTRDHHWTSMIFYLDSAGTELRPTPTDFVLYHYRRNAGASKSVLYLLE